MEKLINNVQQYQYIYSMGTVAPPGAIGKQAVSDIEWALLLSIIGGDKQPR